MGSLFRFLLGLCEGAEFLLFLSECPFALIVLELSFEPGYFQEAALLLQLRVRLGELFTLSSQLELCEFMEMENLFVRVPESSFFECLCGSDGLAVLSSFAAGRLQQGAILC